MFNEKRIETIQKYAMIVIDLENLLRLVKSTKYNYEETENAFLELGISLVGLCERCLESLNDFKDQLSIKITVKGVEAFSCIYYERVESLDELIDLISTIIEASKNRMVSLAIHL